MSFKRVYFTPPCKVIQHIYKFYHVQQFLFIYLLSQWPYYHAYNGFFFSYYINYKLMKKKVKQYAQQIEVGAQDRRHVLKDFSRMLDNQVCWKMHIRSPLYAIS